MPIATGIWTRIRSTSQDVIDGANLVRSLWSNVAPQADAPACDVEVELDAALILETDEQRFPPNIMEWQNGTHAEVTTNGGWGALQWDSSEAPLRGRFRIAAAQPQRMVPAVLRFLSTLVVIPRGLLVVHASAVAITADDAILFLGSSGAGKTSTARRLGREGARRIADDKVLIRFGDILEVEPFCLDTGGWLRGRPGSRYRARAASVVAKGAAETRVGDLVGDPLNTWFSAVITPPLPPWGAELVLDRTVELAIKLPTRQLAVAPRGEILEPLRSFMLPFRAG